jgi:hypothetical protein
MSESTPEPEPEEVPMNEDEEEMATFLAAALYEFFGSFEISELEIELPEGRGVFYIAFEAEKAEGGR